MNKKSKKLRDIAHIITGKTPPTAHREYYGEKFPFITPSDIPTYKERKLSKTERFLSEKGAEYQNNLRIPRGATCFVAIGSTVGKMCLATKDSFTNQQLHTLIAKKGKVDKRYLFYLMRYIYPWIKSIADARGSGKAIINKTDFGKTEITLPKLPVQEKIGAILSAYDDLIENNKRRIAFLEKMAKEIYREWFVRMRFPGHEKVKFIKGIPENWTTETIGKICKKVTDGSHLSPVFYSNGKYMASVKDMQSHGFTFKSIKTISEQDFERLAKSDCKPLKNDVLIAKDGSYLKHVFVWNHDYEVVILSSIAILRPNLKKILPYFLSLVLKQESTKSMMSGYVSGSALPRIILKDFKKMKLLIPEINLIKKLESTVEPIYKNINRLDRQIEYLEIARDRLISRLISEKLSVKDLDIQFPPSMQDEQDVASA